MSRLRMASANSTAQSSFTGQPDTPPQSVERRARMSARLRELHKTSGLSLRAVAKRAGLSRQTVMSALKSGLNTSPRTYEKLFSVLDTTPKLEGALLEPRFTQEDLEITMAYHDAPTPIRNVVSKILKTREHKNLDLSSQGMALAYRFDKLSPETQAFIEMVIDFSERSQDVKTGT